MSCTATIHQALADCAPGVRGPGTKTRQLVVPDRLRFEALQAAKARIASAEGKAEYLHLASVEGALSQAVKRCGLRRSRYWVLAQTHLQHVATAVALNFVRAVEHLQGRPLAQTRTSRFTRLEPHLEPRLAA